MIADAIVVETRRHQLSWHHDIGLAGWAWWRECRRRVDIFLYIYIYIYILYTYIERERDGGREREREREKERERESERERERGREGGRERLSHTKLSPSLVSPAMLGRAFCQCFALAGISYGHRVKSADPCSR